MSEYGLDSPHSFTVHINKIKSGQEEKVGNFLISRPATIIKRNIGIKHGHPINKISIGGDPKKAPSLLFLERGSYDGITDKMFDIIHHKGAFYYSN